MESITETSEADPLRKIDGKETLTESLAYWNGEGERILKACELRPRIQTPDEIAATQEVTVPAHQAEHFAAIQSVVRDLSSHRRTFTPFRKLMKGRVIPVVT